MILTARPTPADIRRIARRLSQPPSVPSVPSVPRRPHRLRVPSVPSVPGVRIDCGFFHPYGICPRCRRAHGWQIYPAPSASPC